MFIHHPLPECLRTRQVTMADLTAVTDLIITCDIADMGKPDYSEDELMQNWQRANFNLATDAIVLITPDEKIIGYTDLCPSRGGLYISALTHIHPNYRHLNLEDALFEMAEEYACQRITSAKEDATLSSLVWTISTDEKRLKLLEQRSYRSVNTEWRMEIDLHESPLPLTWPAGITVRPFVAGQDEQVVHQLIQNAFQDLQDYEYESFEDWQAWAFHRGPFNPALIPVVMSGTEAIGVAWCYAFSDGGAWIYQLAIAQAWRKQGLGLHLLRQSFYTLYQHGVRNVGLTVDLQNVTGAARLYERAGMHLAERHDTCEKQLDCQ
ncbi:GNAT family N-acetyltransferase [Dictyobacter kobayashii]|uniref:N-acetyltransferase domain-containing protein n=1 Tax=Dictyobacter kobayashii TaxID=2014872 RepID=A0A402ANW0_9CHLR|nr:GNAT family N-acetyltransferase [Dictyobacter kobayashii]GCE20714.1 hypothetical protein KDK_45140 [Dictyobacter kobayashii]